MLSAQHRRGLPVRRRRAHGHGVRGHRRRRPAKLAARGAKRLARLAWECARECDAVAPDPDEAIDRALGDPGSPPRRPARRRRQRRRGHARATRHDPARGAHPPRRAVVPVLDLGSRGGRGDRHGRRAGRPRGRRPDRCRSTGHRSGSGARRGRSARTPGRTDGRAVAGWRSMPGWPRSSTSTAAARCC